MNSRFLSLLAVSAALISGSLTAAAAPHKHSRAISQAQAVKIAKKRVGGGRVTDIDHSDGRGKSKSAEAVPNTMWTSLHKADASSKWIPTTTATINGFLRKPDYCMSGFSVFRRPQACLRSSENI